MCVSVLKKNNKHEIANIKNLYRRSRNIIIEIYLFKVVFFFKHYLIPKTRYFNL